jgi:hypothetical protein
MIAILIELGCVEELNRDVNKAVPIPIGKEVNNLED